MDYFCVCCYRVETIEVEALSYDGRMIFEINKESDSATSGSCITVEWILYLVLPDNR
jgi:hypothetical protein